VSPATSIPCAPVETQRKLQQALDGIWLRNRSANAARVAVLEKAGEQLAAGVLNRDGALEAAREAHKLAGGLGSFGFLGASDAARELEQFWRSIAENRTRHIDPEQVSELLEVLRRTVQNATPAALDAGSPADEEAATGPGEPVDFRDAQSENSAVDVALVEDDVVVSGMLNDYFSRLDLTVKTYADGESAVRSLTGAQPAMRARVILLDYDLPGEDGLAVLRRLRDCGVLQESRVIMMSVSAAREAIARAINAGVNGFIAKPFVPSSVLERVHACLRASPPLFVMAPASPAPLAR
jgi:CheY-like chemotaxis protein/HPt (histidine-containing phosphotransfer) domain-containing protein